MPYGYASGVVHDGHHVAAKVKTWMVCYDCGHYKGRMRT